MEYQLKPTIKKKINNYDNVIIDTKSFAENINYTLLNHKIFDQYQLPYNDFNVLNTYMGAQTFESWGLTSMLKYALQNKNINILIATENIVNTEKNISSMIYINAGYNNKFKKKEFTLNSDDTYIINYNLVYDSDYYYGNRKNDK